MKRNKKLLLAVLCASAMTLSSCDDILDIDPPTDSLSSDLVFTTQQGIETAATGLYVDNFLNNSVYYSYLATFCSLWSDDMKYRTTSYAEFYTNTLNPQTSYVSSIWSNLYGSVRQSNDFIENVDGTSIMNEADANVYVADALCLRALAYFCLVNMYGDVPLVLSTDASTTASLPRVSRSEIYAQIESDLLKAAEKFGDNDRGVMYFSANACYAFLARVYTYTEQWDKAIEYANKVLPVADGGSCTKYQLEDVDNVFKTSSKEAIFSANIEGYSGSGTYVGYTREGNMFVPSGTTVNYQLTTSITSLLQADSNDKRNHWISKAKNVYYAYKYKNRATPANSSDYEYQNWFRLAEMYLIRAEAQAHKDNIASSVSDVNKIRERAGVSDIDAEGMTQQALLDLILEERHKEFFSEMGHRFFDLRRTGKLDEAMSKCDWKQWESYKQWMPIPQTEIDNNRNLTQNDDY